MAQVAALLQDNVWLHKQRFEEAEAHYYAVKAGTVNPSESPSKGGGGSLSNDISQARQQIQNALKQPAGTGSSQGAGNPQVLNRLDNLEKVTKDLQALVLRLENRLNSLEKGGNNVKTSAGGVSKPEAGDGNNKADNDDSGSDLDFSDSGDEEEKAAAEAKKQKLLEAYHAKKAAKPTLIAKSSIVFDCKPWDDETDMKELERLVRTVEKDGLVWGASKLAEIAYGVKKLTIMCTVVDDKIGVEDLKEELEGFDEYIQSVDIAAFNKI